MRPTLKKRRYRSGAARLEVFLGLATLVLLFQLLPSLWSKLIWAIDMRNWSGSVWLGANIGLVLVLCAIRFRRELRLLAADIFSRKRRLRRSAQTFMTDDGLDYETRTRRDAEWRERAKERLPFI